MQTGTLTLGSIMKKACLIILVSGMSMVAFGHGKPVHKSADKPAFIALEATPTGPQLIYVDSADHLNRIYKIPKHDRLHQFSHHPKNSSLLMAYSDNSTGHQGIFSLDYHTNSEKQRPKLSRIITDQDPNTWLFDPIYTPDEKTIFYISAQLEPNSTRANRNLKLMRYSVASKKSEIVASGASNPSLSEHGRYLTYLIAKEKIVVIDLQTQQTTEYPVPKPNLRIQFPMLSEHHDVLHLFANEIALTTQIPFLKSAWAHPGKKHQQSYGWKFNVSDQNLNNAIKTPAVADLKAAEFHKQSGKLAYLDETGIHLYSLESDVTELRYTNQNLWKFRFTP